MRRILRTVKKLDEQRRAVLSKEMCDTLGIAPLDRVEITCENQVITIRAIEAKCKLCGGTEDVDYINDIPFCGECREFGKKRE